MTSAQQVEKRQVYLIQKSCLPCDACGQTGWKTLSATQNKKRAKQLAKYWRRYFGREVKIRIK